jgi:hypothetical protein
MKKILVGSGISVLILGIAAAVVWWLWRPQTVTLSDGAKLTLVKVTYGKQHKAPSSADTRGRGMTIAGTNDFLVVWIRQDHKINQWPNYQLYAYDQAGSACVGYSGMSYGNSRQRGREVVGVRFDAFPRRAGKIILRLQEWNRQTGQQTTKNAFVISNPARGPFPKWFPDSLPNTQSDDDLDVTLNQLVFGVKIPWQRNNSAADDAMNKGVQVAFDVQQNGHAATNWQPVQMETSDATGNHANGYVNTTAQNGEPMTFYQYGLWPDEPAWKLRVEFSRTSGFKDDELWTIQNIPVADGKMQDFWNNYGRNRNDPAFAETTLGDTHLKIFSVKHFTDQPSGSQSQGGVQIQTDKPLDGARMTIVKVTDDQGRDIQSWNWGWGGTYYTFGLRELNGARFLNLTIALHKSRFVEFVAKPMKP